MHQPAIANLPSPFSYRDACLLSLTELQLTTLAGSIRDKPQWIDKLRVTDISGRWKAEAAAQGASEQTIRYVFQQLEYEATQQHYGTEGGVPGVFTHDTLVPDELRDALLDQVDTLEHDEIQDWHPGSNQLVRDLIHPSLYCLVYGVSRQLPKGSVTLADCLSLAGAGTPVPAPTTPAPRYARNHETITDSSVTTQWLPTNFDVDHDGAVRPASYINNLHPIYEEMYRVVSSVLQLQLPLFERVLAGMLCKRPRIIEWGNSVYRTHAYDKYVKASLRAYLRDVGDPDYEEEAEDSDDDGWSESAEPPPPPPPPPPQVPAAFVAPPPPAPVSLKGRRLQVIVKLASIHLTPAAPKYSGGTWHVEGMRNESIVATGIYYFDQDNVTDSHLAFRVSVQAPGEVWMGEDDFDDRALKSVLGLSRYSPLNQVLGQVTTLPGRCLCFPNTYQHQVQPFQLKDTTRRGHRKILVFFLVDPSQEVLSTSEIPPQQQEWVEAETEQGSSCPFSYEQACKYRETLMKERSVYVRDQNQTKYEAEFSLCEH